MTSDDSQPDQGPTTATQIAETAVGVLGDSIDWEGHGWEGRPWFMLVTRDQNDHSSLTSFDLRSDTPAAQTTELIEYFRSDRPVGCAYVQCVDKDREGRALTAVVAALDGHGDSQCIACDVARAEDGRQALAPIDGAWPGLPDGVLAEVVTEAWKSARALLDE